MKGDLLPLFPLEVVLLPHAPLPLHIFEERYREMINECLALELEFGVVQARGNGILRIGCTAAIDHVIKRHEDGRIDILAVGQRRFEVMDIDNERSFLRGKVKYFDDDSRERAGLELRSTVLAAYRAIEKLTGQEDEEVDIEEPDLSFHLGRISDDLDFRQTLLGVRNEAERMQRLAEHFKILSLRYRTRDKMQRVVRQNGHGSHLGDLSSHS